MYLKKNHTDVDKRFGTWVSVPSDFHRDLRSFEGWIETFEGGWLVGWMDGWMVGVRKCSEAEATAVAPCIFFDFAFTSLKQ